MLKPDRRERAFQCAFTYFTRATRKRKGRERERRSGIGYQHGINIKSTLRGKCMGVQVRLNLSCDTISSMRHRNSCACARVYTRACAFSQQPCSITIQVDVNGECATAERSMVESSISRYHGGAGRARFDPSPLNRPRCRHERTSRRCVF
jgi:hypothetical protein